MRQSSRSIRSPAIAKPSYCGFHCHGLRLNTTHFSASLLHDQSAHRGPRSCCSTLTETIEHKGWVKHWCEKRSDSSVSSIGASISLRVILSSLTGSNGTAFGMLRISGNFRGRSSVRSSSTPSIRSGLDRSSGKGCGGLESVVFGMRCPNEQATTLRMAGPTFDGH